jgi:hypothetical protein
MEAAAEFPALFGYVAPAEPIFPFSKASAQAIDL